LEAFLTLPLLTFQNGSFNELVSTYNGPLPIPGNLTPQAAADFPGLYPTATYGNLVSRVLISEWTVGVYSSLCGILYIWCILCLGWALRFQGPPRTNLGLLDFTTRVCAGEPALSKEFKDAGAAEGAYRQKFQNRDVFLGTLKTEADVGDEESKEGQGVTLESNRTVGSTSETIRVGQTNRRRIGFAWNGNLIEMLKR